MFRITSAAIVFLIGIVHFTGAESPEEQKIDALLRAHFPKSEILSIRKANALGLWEAFVDGQIVYVDKRKQFLIAGSIYEVKSMQNLTDAALARLRNVPFSALPKQLAVTRISGNGARRFAVFEDPFCGFCRALEPELDQLSDYTAYIFMYPIFGDQSVATAAAAWCGNDRLTSWRTALTLKQPLAPLQVDAPIDRLIAFGRRLGIMAHATVFRMEPGATGYRRPG